MAAICDRSEPASRPTWRATSSMAPELESPRLTISTSAMIIVAGWPNPEKAASFGTTPLMIARIRATNATRS